MYVTGGADHLLKIWNLDRRSSCQAVLRGHTDYVRWIKERGRPTMQ
jgi:WD40 repeat protein